MSLRTPGSLNEHGRSLRTRRSVNRYAPSLRTITLALALLTLGVVAFLMWLAGAL